jgi:hypothetical protein
MLCELHMSESLKGSRGFYQYNDLGSSRMSLDITIAPLYRVDGQEPPSLPGLMAAVPPRNAARGRDQDRLVVYLLLAGKAVLSSGECVQAASRAAVAFFETPGAVTSALRSAAGSINQSLHKQNLSSAGPGKYAIGVLALAAIRESRLTLLLSGPMHAFVLAAEGARHIFESLSGRGLGLSERTPYYFSQIDLRAGDRIVLCAAPPTSWEYALRDSSPASLDGTRRRLMASVTDDVNAVMVHATDGSGILTMQRPPGTEAARLTRPAGTLDSEAAHSNDAGVEMRLSERARDAGLDAAGRRELGHLAGDRGESADQRLAGPPAYAIPPDRYDEHAETSPELVDTMSYTGVLSGTQSAELELRKRSTLSPERARRTARTIIAALDSVRRVQARLGLGTRSFLPRLLPGADQRPWSLASPAMMFIAVLVPLLVVTVASAVYFRYGRSVQYEQYLVQAQNARTQAVNLTDAVAQREAWQRELFYLDKAEAYTQTSETRGLRAEAQQRLDELLGVSRLQFEPVLSTSLGAQIGRLAASENDLYLLDSERGQILHLGLMNSGFQLDTAFGCAPGSYGGYTVGPLVDILAMPPTNSLNAGVVGVDAGGTLLYCAPGQVAQAVPLPPPDTNWGRVRAFTLDAGNLYVLDAQSHAVWVYVGKDGTFVDRPYFFFGGQIPELEDAIDLAVSADDLYVLHSDGHVSTCSYSRLEAVPTRCVDPAALVNPFPAYRNLDLFSEAHFTQMMFSPVPDPELLLLDSDGQGVFRLAPRSLELQSQMRPVAGRASSMPPGQVTAMAVSPNHILYFALSDRIYFASDGP